MKLRKRSYLNKDTQFEKHQYIILFLYFTIGEITAWRICEFKIFLLCSKILESLYFSGIQKQISVG